jgi:hypothetical protein
MKTLILTLVQKPKAVAILLLILFASDVLCQNQQNACNNIINDTSIYEENILGEPFYLKEMHQGQNFYTDDWHYGNVVLENGGMIYNKILNYHLLSHQLLWIRASDNSLIAVEKELVKEFIIPSNDGVNESLFKKLKIRSRDMSDSVEAYVQVLTQGYINLYAFRKSIIGKYSQSIIPDDEYYIQINNGKIKWFSLSRRSLYAAVGENENIMKTIVRSNHLRIRKEYGLIKAVNIFNQEIFKR